jgi:hypothetical protein
MTASTDLGDGVARQGHKDPELVWRAGGRGGQHKLVLGGGPVNVHQSHRYWELGSAVLQATKKITHE